MNRSWTRLVDDYEEKWKEIALALMKRFCESTNGSFIEVKERVLFCGNLKMLILYLIRLIEFMIRILDSYKHVK